MNKKIIQPLGLQRSGTNYIARLITDNFHNQDFEIREVYWKHNFTPPLLNHNHLAPANIITFIYKDLFTWIESIAYRHSWDYEYKHQVYHPFEPTEPDYTLGPKKLNLINLAKTYNKYLENWLVTNVWLTVNADFTNKLIQLKYESLLDNSFLEKLFTDLTTRGLQRISNNIILPKLGDVDASRFDYPANHLENLKNKQTLFLTDKQKEMALAQISPEVLKIIRK